MTDAFRLAGTVGVDISPLEAGLSKAGGLVSGFGSSVAGVGAQVAKLSFAAVAVGAAAVGTGFGASVKQAADFEKTLSAVAAVSNATADQMKQLSGLALKLGADTSFSATEAAQGIEELVKAGVSMGDVMGGAAKASLDLAAAGAVSVAEAAEIASNAMNVFKISGSNMAHVADVIAGAANASAIDVGDFKFSLAAAGSVAAAAGIGFEDLSTAIAVMGQAGIKGSDAGTSLKTMLMNLQPSTKAQIEEFKRLGLTTKDGGNAFFDASGKAKSLAEISGLLQKSMAGMTKQQQLASLELLFGSDAIRAAAIMAEQGAEGFREMAGAIGQVTAADVAEKRLDNLTGSVEKFKGVASSAAITLGMGFTPSIRKLVDAGTATLTSWMPTITLFADKIPSAMDAVIGKVTSFVPTITGAFTELGQVVGGFLGLELDDYAAGWDTWGGIVRRSLDLAGTAVAGVVGAVRTGLPVVRETLSSLLPVALNVGKAFVTNITDTITFVTQRVLPPLTSILSQTAGFFTSTLLPALATTGSVMRGVLGDTLDWLAKTVWPPLLVIGQQTASFWTSTMLPAIQSVAGPLRTVLGESIQWLADTGWPALLAGATVVTNFLSGTVAPMLPGLASGVREVLGGAISWIAETGWPMFLTAASTVSSFITGTVVPAVSGLVGWLTTNVPPAVQGVLTAFEAVRSRLAPVVTAIFSGDLSTALKGLGSAFSDFASMAVGWLGAQVARIDWGTVWRQTKDVLGSTASWFADAAVRFGSWIGVQVGKIDWAEVWKQARDVSLTMGAWFLDVGTRFAGWIGQKVSEIDWSAVWATARDVSLSMGAWFVDVTARFAGWISEKIAQIDWAAVWSTSQDVVAGLGQWFWGVTTTFAGWLGEKIAQIEWGEVWSKAVGVVGAMAQWYVDLYISMGRWLGEQVALIDWLSVWKQARDMAAAMQTSFAAEAAKIDWKAVLDANVSAAQQMWTWLNTTVAKIDWKTLGTNFGSFVATMAIDSLYALTLAPVDLARSFYGWISAALKGESGIDWKILATDFGNATIAMIQAIESSAIIRAIGDFFFGFLQGAWDAAIGRFKPTMPTFGASNTEALPGGSPVSQGSGGSSANFGPIDNSSRTTFVKTAWPYMLEAAGGDRNLAELMLAKAISENGDIGKGGGFIGNNFSGIKGKGSAGSFTAMTWEKINGQRVNMPQEFAAYNTPQEGFAAFMKFLQDNSNYKDALARYQKTGDANQLFRDINAAGYATDDEWADKVQNIRKNQVAPFTKDLEGVRQAYSGVSTAAQQTGQTVTQTTGAFSAMAPIASEAGGNLRGTAVAAGIASEGIAGTGKAAGSAGKDLLGLGYDFGRMSGVMGNTASAMRSGVVGPINLMTADALTSVTRLGDGIHTITTDAAGNAVSTFTNLQGQVTSQIATLANGVTLDMAGMATNSTSSIVGMGDRIQTIVRDASGAVLTTITDLSGNVVGQTVAMSSGVVTAAGTMSTDVIGKVLAMKDGTLQVTRELNGDLTTVVKDLSGNVVEKYTTMQKDAAGQAAELARATAISFAATGKSANSLASDIKDLGGVFASSLSQFSGTFTFTTPGRRAAGGPVSGYQPYIVGELGPELFVPPGDGTIIPTHQLGAMDGGGGSGDSTVVFDFRGATITGFDNFEAQLQAALERLDTRQMLPTSPSIQVRR